MRRGEHGPQAFQAPVDVHASADGQVYMFKRRANELSGSSDEEELSLLEMTPRVQPEQEQDRLRNAHLLEREVTDGDSLNKLALQYGCKVSDLKRVNNLMQEQDFFALKSIKIPIQKHSFLTETLADPTDPQDETSFSANPPERARAHPHVREVTDFLMEVDSDMEKLIQTTNDEIDEFADHSEARHRLAGGLGSHGADWGIKWWNAVVAMILIGIILPLFYVIYYKLRKKE
ncbi:lysM and putative peptidoglycan-binding domain-containing protein 4 [Nelusetta ayraudi]|uniref:lysM and putative peptidoglycan-binding domain-containing protein 4 n=1 Tax=Nelusetta ayraudi TaxID=303726 RepID=UPI003F7280F9